MSKLQFRKSDELELGIGQAVAGSLRQSKKENPLPEAALDSDRKAGIEVGRDSLGLRSMVTEKDLDRPSLTSKYARVISCSFEQEIGN